MQTNAHPMPAGDNASLHHVEISLLKEEIALIAGHKLLKKAVIQLTLEEYRCLKAALLSTDTFFNYTATFNSNHAEPTIANLDERKIFNRMILALRYICRNELARSC